MEVFRHCILRVSELENRIYNFQRSSPPHTAVSIPLFSAPYVLIMFRLHIHHMRPIQLIRKRPPLMIPINCIILRISSLKRRTHPRIRRIIHRLPWPSMSTLLWPLLLLLLLAVHGQWVG